MITDIPTPDDFREAGVAYLNLAWESATQLALDAGDMDLTTWDNEGTVTEDYWSAAQRKLGKSVTLALQGAEFLLKAKIAAISPFLLIVQNVSEWPRGSARNDVSFADFKTVDAQDLCRLHDTVAIPRLDDEFQQLFVKLRRLRNTVMHTVDPHLRFTSADIAIDILILSEHLVGPKQWMQVRYDYLDKDPGGVVSYDDYRHCILGREFSLLRDLLAPSQTKRFFGFNKKQRTYRCPGCSHTCADWSLELNSALLKPNTKHSKMLYCIVCREQFEVDRIDCTNDDCKGNVAYEGECMTCGHDM